MIIALANSQWNPCHRNAGQNPRLLEELPLVHRQAQPPRTPGSQPGQYGLSAPLPTWGQSNSAADTQELQKSA